MHTVWANSIRLCLPYSLGLLLFLIFRNYLRYNINDKSHWGYTPLTFEELCVSLLSGRATSCMEPLEVEIEKSSSELSMYDSRSQGQSSFNAFLSLLGFSAEEFDGRDAALNDNHLEFPLSDGKKHPKLKIEEAYNRRTKKRTGKYPADYACHFNYYFLLIAPHFTKTRYNPQFCCASVPSLCQQQHSRPPLQCLM